MDSRKRGRRIEQEEEEEEQSQTQQRRHSSRSAAFSSSQPAPSLSLPHSLLAENPSNNVFHLTPRVPKYQDFAQPALDDLVSSIVRYLLYCHANGSIVRKDHISKLFTRPRLPAGGLDAAIEAADSFMRHAMGLKILSDSASIQEDIVPAPAPVSSSSSSSSRAPAKSVYFIVSRFFDEAAVSHELRSFIVNPNARLRSMNNDALLMLVLSLVSNEDALAERSLWAALEQATGLSKNMNRHTVLGEFHQELGELISHTYVKQLYLDRYKGSDKSAPQSVLSLVSLDSQNGRNASEEYYYTIGARARNEIGELAIYEWTCRELMGEPCDSAKLERLREKRSRMQTVEKRRAELEGNRERVRENFRQTQ